MRDRETSGPGQTHVSTSSSPAPRTVIQCSNGNMSRVQTNTAPASITKPSLALSSSMSSRLTSNSLRGSSGDLENYNDIRPDILEMIKEEQKV